MINRLYTTQLDDIYIHTFELPGCGVDGRDIFETKIVCTENTTESKILNGYRQVTYNLDSCILEHDQTVYLAKFILYLMGKENGGD